VIEPLTPGCCGMAGDRGLLHPELPAAALGATAAELSGRELDGCVSCNRTCELALEGVTGRPYESIVMTLERLSRTAPTASNGAPRPLAGRL
jgi:D-lactate dehydrogenase